LASRKDATGGPAAAGMAAAAKRRPAAPAETPGAPTPLIGPERPRETRADREKFQSIGRPFRRVDGRAKVTGLTKFADDLNLPRMLYAKLLRSHVPHARIVAIDTSAAEALPGVLAVITGREFPVPFGILPVSQDEHALCTDRVRFVGDPVAAVAAIDEDTAFDAMNLIKVQYEPLTTIGGIADALTTPEPRIHDYGDEGNIHKLVALEFGDVDAALAGADRVVEGLYFFEGNTHLAMEQHATVAFADPDGKVTIWSSTQTPHYLHKAASKVLGLPPSHIRVIAMPNGGGFGGKSDPFNHEIVVAKLSQMTGRPVKITLTREEVFYCHRGRHPVLMSIRTGVTKDGAMTGMHFRSILDGGGYGSYGVASTFYTGALQTVTYEVPTYRFEGARCFTNKPPCGPKRGHGTPQPRFALEVHLDKVAEELGQDPAELRLKTLQPANSVTANYLKIGSMGLGACIRKVVDGSDWKNRFRKLPHGKGLGLACSSYITGAGLPIYWNAMPHSGVQLKLDRGGGVTIFCGSTEIGQGSDTILAHIVSEILGVDPFDIRVVTADTDLTPVDLGSYSSRVTIMTGNAAIQACERAKELLAKAVAEKLSTPKKPRDGQPAGPPPVPVPAGRLVFAGRRVFDAEDPERGLSFADAVVAAETKFGTIGTVGSYTPPPSPGKYKGAGVGPSPAYSYSAAVVEVDVDPETGIITVPKIWIAHDVGQCINPILTMGQVEGSVYMGLGEALMEEMTYRENRNVVHKIPSLLEYKSPTTLEMPEVVTYLIEDPDPNGPYGAKEVGQGPLLPIMPAVANAVYDAVGVRVDEVPITPDKVLKALRDKAAGRPGRYGPKRFPTVDWPEPIRMKTPAEGGDGTPISEPPPRKKTPAVETAGAAGGSSGTTGAAHPAGKPRP
jgi:4-hydroxybenzoyl-CoA reductase subunit alpha